MSSSDKVSLRRCGCGYLIAAAACGVFGFAYKQFSHGAYSECMLLFFLIPLLGRALPSFLLLSAGVFRGGRRAACGPAPWRR